MSTFRKAGGLPGPARWALAFALLLTAAIATAADPVYDYAEVLRVEPVTETVQARPVRTACAPREVVVAGDLRTAEPQLDLVAAIRREAARPAVSRSTGCGLTPAAMTTERVVAYRVKYRYGGEVYQRRMREHPGERLRVRVSVRPQRR